jgi:hypothetical protein
MFGYNKEQFVLVKSLRRAVLRTLIKGRALSKGGPAFLWGDFTGNSRLKRRSQVFRTGLKAFSFLWSSDDEK